MARGVEHYHSLQGQEFACGDATGKLDLSDRLYTGTTTVMCIKGDEDPFL